MICKRTIPELSDWFLQNKIIANNGEMYYDFYIIHLKRLIAKSPYSKVISRVFKYMLGDNLNKCINIDMHRANREGELSPQFNSRAVLVKNSIYDYSAHQIIQLTGPISIEEQVEIYRRVNRLFNYKIKYKRQVLK